jgi:hypothetical protein
MVLTLHIFAQSLPVADVQEAASPSSFLAVTGKHIFPFQASPPLRFPSIAFSLHCAELVPQLLCHLKSVFACGLLAPAWLRLLLGVPLFKMHACTRSCHKMVMTGHPTSLKNSGARLI